MEEVKSRAAPRARGRERGAGGREIKSSAFTFETLEAPVARGCFTPFSQPRRRQWQRCNASPTYLTQY